MSASDALSSAAYDARVSFTRYVVLQSTILVAGVATALGLLATHASVWFIGAVALIAGTLEGGVTYHRLAREGREKHLPPAQT
jgi:hypothetical protein